MKTLKDLTPEIRAKIALYKENATKDLYNGTEYNNWNRKDTVEYIEKTYSIAKQKNKPVVVVADTIKQYILFYNLLFNEKMNKKYKSLVNKTFVLKNKSKDELTDGFKCVNNELSNELRNELSNELYNELSNELDTELRNELSNELYNELDNELSEAKSHWTFITNEYARVYLMWYKFIKDEFKLPTKKAAELDWLYEKVNKANISKVFLCDKVVLVLRMPKKIIRNNGFISNTEGAAIIYPDQQLYYINGFKITKDLFDSLSEQKYTFDDWTKENNEEIKSVVLAFYQQKFGDEFVFRFLSNNLNEIDTYVDKKEEKFLEGTTKGMNIGVYTLFKGKVNSTEIAYVRCYCPSTDRMFFLGVDPINTNAKDAIASLYTIPTKLKEHITSIQRQGEVFSTNFTEKGLELIKTMDKVDFSDTTSISGDSYFNLIRYEY